MHTLFEAQAARTPDATAVIFESEALSYAELDARANRVAQVLLTLEVGPDTLVGLHMPRSVEMIVGAIAIHKAGGAYVPLDPGYPADRIAHYLEDSGAPIVLTRSDVADRLPECSATHLLVDADPRIAAAPTGPVASRATPENLAYVIYTSGSTGKPKGVMIEHRNVANFYAGMDDRIGATEPGVWLAVTSLSFDISVLELFWTLARGFTVVLSGDREPRRSSPGTDRSSATARWTSACSTGATTTGRARTSTSCCWRARSSLTRTASPRSGRPSATSTPSAAPTRTRR